MKTRAFLFCFAATALLASCSLEPKGPENVIPDGITELRVGLTETKTVLGDKEGTARKVYWTDGDIINVNGVDSEALTGVAEKSTSAVFTFGEAVTAPLNVLYPAAFYHGAGEITMPADQQYVAGGFASGSLPMAGSGDSVSEVALKHLCSVLRLSILKSSAAGADEDEIASVSFKGNAGEQVCGVFSLDNATGILTGLSTAAADQTVIMPGINQALSTSEPLEVYLVVPAREYASGFTVTVTDSEGHAMAKSLNQSKELEAGKIYLAGEFAFEPAADVDLDITINSADDLVAFAQAWNNNDYNGADVNITLGSNISFNSTTNAAYKATGGIGTHGETTNHFHGVFDGNGKTISGYAAGVPLFAYTGTSCTIKDFTMDASCNVEFTPNDEANGEFGPIVGYQKGLLDNVTVKATVSLAAASGLTTMTSLGGIVGRSNGGTISNCSFDGAISLSDGFETTGKLLVGGILGYASNKADVISACTLNGTINSAASVPCANPDEPDTKNPYHIIGGIVGYNKGSVSGCSTTDHPTIQTAYSTGKGTIVVQSTVSYFTAVGGIVGENLNEITDCTNAAGIFNTIFKLDAANMNARYMKVGGIVGKNDADGLVSNCTNNGSVQHRSNPRLQALGGIAGNNSGGITSCTNNGAVNHMTTGITGATKKGGRIINIGGVIGENYGSPVSDVHNTADLQVSAMESNYDATNDKPVCEARMGGVAAYNSAEIDGGSSKNTNSGKIYFNCNSDKEFIGFELGGIVGLSSASVKNAKNSGYVLLNWNSNTNVLQHAFIGGVVGKLDASEDPLTISGCENAGGNNNAGEVHLNSKSGSAKHTGNYAGGILGYSEQSVDISNCENSGYVHGGNGTKQNGTTCYTGGIVAYLSGASSISSCKNSAVVSNDHSNNTDDNVASVYNGGIAGYLLGSSENRIAVNNCSNIAENMSSKRGWLGGITGYAEYADFNNCTFNQSVTLSSMCRGIGGIVGWGSNVTLTSCTFSGSELSSTQIQENRAGGIAGKLDNSTVNACRSSVTTMMNHIDDTAGDKPVDGGAIVGISDAGNTIKACHYKPTINGADAKIAGTGDFTDGGGNTADL